MKQERPYVFLNTATTADGKIDTIDRCGATISSPIDKVRVDRLRAGSDAILVGGKTLIGDDPKLTVKSGAFRAERVHKGLEENPVKVGIITNAGDLSLDGEFITSGPARVMLFTTGQTEGDQIDKLRQQGVQVFIMGDRRVDLVAAFQQLKREGVERLMVEGGGTLNEELLKLCLIDEIIVYIAPVIFGGAGAPTFANSSGLSFADAIRLQLTHADKLPDEGIVTTYQVRY